MNKRELKILVAAAVMLLSGCAYMNAQVTVGANTAPNATLDVVATHTDGTTPEGVIAPRLTLAQLKAADGVYSAAQNGAIVFVTDVTGGTSTKTANITAAGYYYYDATNAVWKGMGGTMDNKLLSNVVHIIDAEYPTSYTVTGNESVIIARWSTAQGKTVVFPELTPADAGRLMYLANETINSAGGPITPVFNNSVGAPGYENPSQGIVRGRCIPIVWTGNQWLPLSR